MITLSIIILSYNTRHLTASCLRSLIKQYPSKLKKEFEIILVDNASTDKTADFVKEEIIEKNKDLQIHIIENKENYGFSKGNNLGAVKAKGKFILFLNSDTEIQDDGLIRMNLYLEQRNNVGILGGGLKNEDRTYQRSVGNFFTLWNTIMFLILGERFKGIRFRPSDNIQDVDWVSGACMMIRSNVFHKLNGFDQSIFMYVEDVDICFRTYKLGFKVQFFPDVSILHKGYGSSNRTFVIVQIYNGILYFFKKHMPMWQYIVVMTILKTKAIVAVIIGIIIRDKYLITTYSKAFRVHI